MPEQHQRNLNLTENGPVEVILKALKMKSMFRNKWKKFRNNEFAGTTRKYRYGKHGARSGKNRSTGTEHVEQDPEHHGSTGTEHMEQDPEPPLPELCLDEDTEIDESLSRDVRYSLEVWVPADKEKLFENLNVSDRQLLTSNEDWLNGTLIDAAMQLLKFQYPSIAELSSSALAIQLDFKRHDMFFFIQIINRLGI